MDRGGKDWRIIVVMGDIVMRSNKERSGRKEKGDD